MTTKMTPEELAKLDPAKVHPDLGARIRSYVRVRDNGGSERAVNAHSKALVETARVVGTDEAEKPPRPTATRPTKKAAKKTAKKAAAKKTASSGS